MPRKKRTPTELRDELRSVRYDLRQLKASHAWNLKQTETLIEQGEALEGKHEQLKEDYRLALEAGTAAAKLAEERGRRIAYLEEHAKDLEDVNNICREKLAAQNQEISELTLKIGDLEHQVMSRKETTAQLMEGIGALVIEFGKNYQLREPWLTDDAGKRS
jgi:phage shock protein A